MNGPNPPRWAAALLSSLLRPEDREPLSGDLLEEYREVRRPMLGVVRANAWYLLQVMSVFVRLIWPFALAPAAAWGVLQLARVAFPPPSYLRLSLVPTPGVSVLDATVYLLAAIWTSRRTRLIRTGIIASASVAVATLVAMFAVVVIQFPDVPIAMVRKPFIPFVIMPTFLAIALGVAIVVGTVGGAIGRSLPPARRRQTRI